MGALPQKRFPCSDIHQQEGIFADEHPLDHVVIITLPGRDGVELAKCGHASERKRRMISVRTGGFYGRSMAVFFAGCALFLSGCDGNILDPRGPIGAAERSILIDATVIMLAIIAPTMIATLAVAWWFRAGNAKARYRPNWAYSGRVELVVWSVPLLTIIFLGGIAWIGSHELDPATPIASKQKTLHVQVVSLDWKWLFIYPEQHVASVNQLLVPVGTPVHFTLTSASVWDSFFVPRLGSMIYTMRGMTTQLNLLADREGSYFGLSTHFSGDGFADMRFDLKSVSADAFDQWIKAAQGEGPPLDVAAYTALAKQSTAVPPSSYGKVDADLFQQVVSQKVAPGPGPSADTPGGVPKKGS